MSQVLQELQTNGYVCLSSLSTNPLLGHLREYFLLLPGLHAAPDKTNPSSPKATV
jgi:hypothetical protein